MSPLKIGTREVVGVKIGSRDIIRVMHGSREIWAADDGGAGYRYYRVVVSAVGSGTAVGTIELELREVVGGPSVAVGAGGTAFASKFSSSRPPSEAFDGVLTANNGCLETSATLPWHLGYDFGAGNEKQVVQYAVSSYPTSTQTSNRSFKDWTFEGSNDGETWDTLDTVIGETGWTLGEQRVFTL